MRFIFTGLLISFVCFQGLFAQNRQISGGHKYSLILCENGTVYGAGDNSQGQIAGVPLSVTSVNLWTPIAGLPSDLVMVDAGTSAHALAIDCKGRVWSWGNNVFGQTGLGNFPVNNEISVPHTVPGIGENFPPAVYVTGGDGNSYAITSVTGNVLAWGRSDGGLLGNGVTTSTGYTTTPNYVLTANGQYLKDIVQIESGDINCYALDKNGNVWAWGIDNNNSLGQGTIGGLNSAFAKQVMADYNGDNITDGPLKNILLLSGGDNHGVSIDVDGISWSWGGNWGPGQLGKRDGHLFASKVNAASDSLTVFPLYNFQTNTLGKSVYSAAGQASSIFLLQDTRVVSTGANSIYINGLQRGDNGTLGNGILSSALGFNTKYTLTPTYVKTGPTTYLTGIQKLADGDAHYFAIDSTDKIYVWGYNKSGNLGLGHNNDIGYATQISLPNGCSVKKSCPTYLKLIAGTKSNGDYILSTNQFATHYIYSWTYKTTNGNWQTLSQGSGVKFKQQLSTTTGWYKLSISTSVSGINCSSCPVVHDSVLITIDCSKTLELGSDKQFCAPFEATLTTTLLGSSFAYTWEYKPTSTAGWNTISNRGIGTLFASYKTNNEGYYRLRVQRPSCPDALDSLQILVSKPINISPSPNSSYCAAQRFANFAVTSTGNNIYWYSDTTLASILNPGVPSKTYTTTTPGILGTSANCYGKQIYFRDGNTTSGNIWKDISTTCGLGATAFSSPAGYRYLLNVTKTLKIDSLSVVANTSFNLPNSGMNIAIFNESTTSSAYCGVCGTSNYNYKSAGALIATSPFIPVTLPVNTPTIVRIPVNIQLTAGQYWIQITTTGIISLYNFTCNPTFSPNSYTWATPATDNSGLNALQILTMEFYNTITNNNGRGNLFNIKYSTEGSATCKFYPVCATTEFIGTPANISSPQQYCPKDSLVLQANTVPGATRYTWSLPPGGTLISAVGPTATIVGGNISGKITVTPIGNCNTGTGYSLDYQGSGSGNLVCSPPSPFTITGLTNVISRQTQVVYSIPFQNGYSYNWSLPPGATGVLNPEQNRITVNFGASSGTITAFVSNAYGSASSSLNVTVNTVTETDVIQNFEWNIYPNPSTGNLIVKNGQSLGFERYEVINLEGKVIQSDLFPNHEQIYLSKDMEGGMYILKIHTPKGVVLKRFIFNDEQ